MADETRDTHIARTSTEMERTVVLGQGTEGATLRVGPPGPLPAVPRQIGPYDLVEQLGQGGMGVVYRAVHRTLGTPCAVKVLVAGEHASAESIARFQREAAAVARMGKHPNIVNVFDLGQEGPLAYYAMELVDGKSLRVALEAGPWTLETSAAMIEKIARTLHFAHEHGIVHRDMKPENVVVRADGEPQVMDFGLAKDARSTSSLSVTGQVFGTPNYMAPEQALGRPDECDARTDVYALGAMLYEMLTRKVPHPGESFGEVFDHIVHGEVARPASLADGLPRDLETVTMKCLESIPSRRYPTAQALAEDLARFRRREPVTARPIGLLERLWRRALRNPLVSALTAALVLAAAVGGLVTWRSRVREAEERREKEEALKAVLLELSRSGSALIDAALARRALGDLAASRSYLDAIEEPVRALIRREPGLAEPWYYRGRMLRAIQRNVEAEEAQDRAIALASARAATAGSRAVLPLALYERGVLRSRRYQDLLSCRRLDLLRARAAQAEPGGTPEDPGDAEIEAAYPEVLALRQGAASDLKRAAAVPSTRATAEALVAALERRADAVELLEGAIATDRWLTEAYEALAADAARGGDWERAAAWYGRGREMDRGYVPFSVGRARALYHLAFHHAEHGEDASAIRKEALDAAEAAIALDPGSPVGWSIKTMTLHQEAQALLAAGKDAIPTLERALAAAKQGEEVDAAGHVAKVNLGVVLFEISSARKANGEDPEPDLVAAIQAFEGAAGMQPGEDFPLYNLAVACHRLGDLRHGRGEDGEADLERARGAYERALAINPRYSQAVNNLAVLRWHAGDAHLAAGGDPTEDYDAAIDGFRRAASMRPHMIESVVGEASVLISKARYVGSLGEDSRELLERAIERLGSAIQDRPDYVFAHLNRATACLLLGEAREARGEPPEEDFDRSIEECRAALRINPRFVGGQRGLSQALLSRARLLAPETDDEDETARRREQAFRLIREALDLAPETAVSMLAHHAYAPLHADPRWEPIANRLRR